GERHQTLPVVGDIDRVMVDRVFFSLAIEQPRERRAAGRRADRDAVVDAGLDLGSLLVIVPGNKLNGIELVRGRVVIGCSTETVEPCLATVLLHDLGRVRTQPRSERVVETGVRGTDG